MTAPRPRRWIGSALVVVVFLAAAFAWRSRRVGYHATASVSVLLEGATAVAGTRTYRFAVDGGPTEQIDVNHPAGRGAEQTAIADAMALDAAPSLHAWAMPEDGGWSVHVEPASGAALTSLEVLCPLGQPLIAASAGDLGRVTVGLDGASLPATGVFRIRVAGVADETLDLAAYGTLAELYADAAARLQALGAQATAGPAGVTVTGPLPLCSGGGSSAGSGRIVVTHHEE